MSTAADPRLLPVKRTVHEYRTCAGQLLPDRSHKETNRPLHCRASHTRPYELPLRSAAVRSSRPHSHCARCKKAGGSISAVRSRPLTLCSRPYRRAAAASLTTSPAWHVAMRTCTARWKSATWRSRTLSCKRLSIGRVSHRLSCHCAVGPQGIGLGVHATQVRKHAAAAHRALCTTRPRDPPAMPVSVHSECLSGNRAVASHGR